ncbi:MAG: helicase-exonuclease AddAB subunit AddA [Ruminococcaceae bacterium]|nr:helicase-exonuclease AddAB subunit AddA [Oscillospiraceae bacterium]
MAREWTKAQSAAIETRGADILVSAAAGSGKTAVLVERIIQRITDRENPVDLDRLLVVTFTNAAASEMRQRIGDALSKKLEEEPNNAVLSRQLSLLPKAAITTIHSYCHHVLRANFNRLGLDPNFRIADPTENELLRLSALDEVMEAMYEDENYGEDFLRLTEAYLHIKNTEPFYALVNHIYDFVMSLPNPKGWLQDAAQRFCVDQDFEQTSYATQILYAGRDCVAAIVKKYTAMLHLAQLEDGGEVLYQFLHGERELFLSLLQETTYEGFYNRLSMLKMESIPRAPKDAQPQYRDTIRAMRDDMKTTELKTLRETLFVLDGEQQRDILLALHPLMSCLSHLVMGLMDSFDKKKEAKNLLNYNDLEHGCYRLFVNDSGQPTPLAQAEQQQYDEILIDEYQDTSALQEAIFSAIKREGGLFLVGDMKQSIYRFRNTNPKLFREKKESYCEEEDAKQRKIILSQNFRSRKGILDGINYIFRRIMSARTGEIDYNEEEMLYPGAVYPDMQRPLSDDVELWMAELGEQDGEEQLESAEAEAVMAARRIAELIEDGYQVLGKDGVRPLTYRDICVLMRSTKNTAAVFCQTLTAWGIPCYSDAGNSFLQSQEITVMLSLLKIIDNPHQDIPLLTVLRSQLYALSTEELASIRIAKRKSDFYDAVRARAEEADVLGNRLRTFLESLSLYREKSRELDTAEFIWYLYRQTGFYEQQASLPGGALRRLNLRLLYTRAAAFENTGLKGLYSFIRFIDEFQSIGGDYDGARAIGEEQNVVRVMSIHKSKGLEFPVVILSGLNRKINMMDVREKILIHSEWGYGPKYIDTDLGISYDNCARQTVRQAIVAESLSEEMRILYVAMTRAREKLIMLASGRNLAARMQQCSIGAGDKRISGAFAAGAGSYLDWILMALYPHPDAALLRKMTEGHVYAPVDTSGHFRLELLECEELFSSPEINVEADCDGQNEERKLLPSWLHYTYPYAEEVALPAKVTVTEIKRKMQRMETDSVYLYPRPVFLMEHSGHITAAEAGTALHTFLEQLDYRNCHDMDSIQTQLMMLQNCGILTEAEANSISVSQVYRFMESSIGARLKDANQVLREVSFGLYVDAEPIFGQKGRVMLQGMIDCVLIEGDDISIVDYKTDRGVDPVAIAERYKTQLAYYAHAAEVMYGRKVSHRYLYLFHFDKLLEV